MTGKHLWETDHPYYCTSGDYHLRGMHAKYATWGAFIDAEAENDPDHNLLFRWDWFKSDNGVMGELELYFALQRKGAQRSVSITVHPDEEPMVRAYLQERLNYLMKVWEPLVLTVEGGGAE